jgi:hypothetical protein
MVMPRYLLYLVVLSASQLGRLRLLQLAWTDVVYLHLDGTGQDGRLSD